MKRYLFLSLVLCFGLLGQAQEDAHKKPDTIALVGWDGPANENVTDERFKEFAEAGFTHNITYYQDMKRMKAGMDLAATHGIKIFVRIPQLLENPEKVVEEFKDHPALAGYYIMDEPKPWEIDTCAEITNRIRKLDTEHPCFVNLYPSYAGFTYLGTWGYRGYVKKFLEEVPTTMLSFDYYPITNSGLRSGWYKNLEIVSEQARKHKIPFWAFVMSTAHRDYPIPTLGHLRLQAYSDLAYGAQGIQYFSYWTNHSRYEDFHGGPIDKKGNKTAVYQYAKQLNEEITALSPVFAGSEVLSVGHLGQSIPSGTKRYKPEPPVKSLDIEGKGGLVSLLEKDSNRYLVIVNRDYESNKTIKITFDGSRAIQRWDKKGKTKPISGSTLQTSVEPGDAVILSWVELSSNHK